MSDSWTFRDGGSQDIDLQTLFRPSNSDSEDCVELSLLRQCLPSTGMTYCYPGRVMHSSHREDMVYDALRGAGHSNFEDITKALGGMFRIARPLVDAAHQSYRNVWDVMSRVRRIIGWAEAIPETVVFELFTALVAARWDFEQDPRNVQTDRDEGDRLVTEIVAFRRAVGDTVTVGEGANAVLVSRVQFDADLYNLLAGGLYDDENGEEFDDGVKRMVKKRTRSDQDGHVGANGEAVRRLRRRTR